MAHPKPIDAFCRHLETIYPPPISDAVLSSMRRPKACSFRVNQLRVDVESALVALRQSALDPTPFDWSATSFSVPAQQRAELTHHPLVGDGRLYVQNASSQLAALLLDPHPDEIVLDLAAAPGGKALHIADRMQNRGRLSVVEPIRTRFFRLKANLERAGVSIARAYMRDGTGVGRDCPAMFDRVLLDAPCSSEARIRLDEPSSYEHWSLRKVRECGRKQVKLLRSALQSVKPGGVVLYCTCSFAVEENEAVVDRLLRESKSDPTRTPGFGIEPLSLPASVPFRRGLARTDTIDLDPTMAGAVRILPNDRFDGFFACALRRV
ncbi:MAG: RsmB/NOP family class I SAM-dependent RNA methyltransferase [Myxococcales bacterium]|nr:RsmB/NOP family class I SAM-dependent RNA methyltransferase [Myxococcales bacterium]